MKLKKKILFVSLIVANIMLMPSTFAANWVWVWSTEYMTSTIDTDSIQSLDSDTKTIWAKNILTDGSFMLTQYAFRKSNRSMAEISYIGYDVDGNQNYEYIAPREQWGWHLVVPGTNAERLYGYVFPIRPPAFYLNKERYKKVFSFSEYNIPQYLDKDTVSIIEKSNATVIVRCEIINAVDEDINRAEASYDQYTYENNTQMILHRKLMSKLYDNSGNTIKEIRLDPQKWKEYYLTDPEDIQLAKNIYREVFHKEFRSLL